MVANKQYENTLTPGFRLRGGKREYVIEDILGRGGFGITYKVKARLHVDNISIDAYFAVKEYFPDICWRDENDNATLVVPKTKSDEVQEGIEDFINEGRRLQGVCNLNHNIVNVNEVFEANGTAYYVLEYLEGGDLRKCLKDNGTPLTEQQMLKVMLPIGQAVQCLHNNSILHLDIKPSNIVMRKNHDGGDDEPVLIDFGIAVHFNNSGTPTSKTPSLGISPGYSPIEQYSGLRKFDPRLDVYAFAATCLYLLTGKDPVEALSIPADYVQNAIPADVSENVKNAIVQAMRKERDYRTTSIKELLHAMILNQNSDVEQIQEDADRTRILNDATPRLDHSLTYERPRKMEQKDVGYEQDSNKKSNGVKKYITIIVSFLTAALIIAGIVFGIKGCSRSRTSNASGSSDIISLQEKNDISEAGEEYITEMMEKDNAYKKTSSGLCYKILKEGNGDNFKDSDIVDIIYSGRHIDGTEFDSSNGIPMPFPLQNVIPGFREVVTYMKPGSKVIAIIPSNLAYGEQGNGPIGPNETLVFELTTVGLHK